MTENVSPIKFCPVCRQTYTDTPLYCSFCEWELAWDNVRMLDEVQGLLEKEEAEKRLKMQQQLFCQSALVMSWQTGSFEKEIFDMLLNGQDSYKEQINQYEANYQANFLQKVKNNESPLLKGIHDLAMGEKQNLFVLDDGPDQITLVRIDCIGDKFQVKFHPIQWDNLLKNLPQYQSRRELALVGGYFKPAVGELGKLIIAGFNSLDAPESFDVLLCSRLYDGQHSKVIHEAAMTAGYQIYPVSYLIGKSLDFKSYLELLVSKAPLHTELALAIVRVSQDGQVTPDYQTIFPSGVFLDSLKPYGIRVRSLNDKTDQINLVVVGKNDEVRQAWKANLAYKQEASLTFALKNRDTIDVTGIPVSPISIKLDELRKNIPSHISIIAQELDLVLVIDTIASPESLRERCKTVKDVLHVLADLEKEKVLRLAVFAYGDHYPSGRFPPPDWPKPVRELRWKSSEEIERFLYNLTSTSVRECDFESALDEVLHELNRLDWRENARRWVLTVGQRPPHPKNKISGSYQAGSPKGLDWSVLVKNLELLGVNSLTLVCPQEWPGTIPDYAQSYAAAFWTAFGYSECLKFDAMAAIPIAEKITKKTEKSGIGLSLPVLIDHNGS